MANTLQSFQHFVDRFFEKDGKLRLVETDEGIQVFHDTPLLVLPKHTARQLGRDSMGEFLEDSTARIRAALEEKRRYRPDGDDVFLASQMRLVISHLRAAARNVPERSEYWAGLVGQICQIKKGAN